MKSCPWWRPAPTFSIGWGSDEGTFIRSILGTAQMNVRSGLQPSLRLCWEYAWALVISETKSSLLYITTYSELSLMKECLSHLPLLRVEACPSQENPLFFTSLQCVWAPTFSYTSGSVNSVVIKVGLVLQSFLNHHLSSCRLQHVWNTYHSLCNK